MFKVSCLCISGLHVERCEPKLIFSIHLGCIQSCKPCQLAIDGLRARYKLQNKKTGGRKMCCVFEEK